MYAAVTRLEMNWLLWVIFSNGFSKYIAEGYAEAFYERYESLSSFPDYGWHRM